MHIYALPGRFHTNVRAGELKIRTCACTGIIIIKLIIEIDIAVPRQHIKANFFFLQKPVCTCQIHRVVCHASRVV